MIPYLEKGKWGKRFSREEQGEVQGQENQRVLLKNYGKERFWQ